MVTDNDGTTNELDQDQQNLDQQGIAPVADEGSVPVGPTNQQLQAANVALEGQIRGLQGKIDTGLNAIRRDSESLATWATGVNESLRGRDQAEKVQQFLGTIESPEERQNFQNFIGLMTPSPQQPVAQPQPVSQEQPQTVDLHQDIKDAWRPYQEFAEKMGVNAGLGTQIDFRQFADINNMPDPNKQQAFQHRVATLLVQGTGAPPAPSAPPANPQGDNPSVQDGGRATVGELRTVDAVRDAYLEGQILVEDYETKMRALGESV